MISTQEFKMALQKNGGRIFDNISPEQLEKYTYIKDALLFQNVSEHGLFKEEFIRLYKFKKKRIKPKFRKVFFEILEKQKNETELNPHNLSHELFSSRLKNYRPKHFAMVTQLMHTVYESYPICDNNIMELFKFSPPKGNKMPTFKKLDKYIEFYNELIGVYREILANDDLYDLIRATQLKFKAHSYSLSQEKALDLLARSAGKLEKEGELLILQYQ